jgi:hypothetical protein
MLANSSPVESGDMAGAGLVSNMDCKNKEAFLVW